MSPGADLSLAETWQSLVKDLPAHLCENIPNLPQLLEDDSGELAVVRRTVLKWQEAMLQSVLGHQSPLIAELLQRIRAEVSTQAQQYSTH